MWGASGRCGPGWLAGPRPGPVRLDRLAREQVIQVDRSRGNRRMPELLRDLRHRDALTPRLDRHRVTETMTADMLANPGSRGQAADLGTHIPRTQRSAGTAPQTAEQNVTSDTSGRASVNPETEHRQRRIVNPDRPRPAPLAMQDPDAASLEI